nr:arabinan endo-1,5-alpha-l-arabinosidase a [Quercus suber]
MACSGTCTDTHDPSLIRRTSDGTYFRFATGGGIPIYTSPSLTGSWTRAGTVLPAGSSIDNAGAKDAWAPDVRYINGEYFLYYAVSTFGTQKSVIGVASSKSMDDGKWTDHGSTGISSTTGDRYNAIDPNLLVVSGTPYLTFGSFWGDIYQTTLATNFVRTTGVAPYEIELNSTSPQPSEGAFVYPYGSYYYLFFSSGSCCGYDTSRPSPGNEYKIMVCRSSKVNSGYVDKSGRSCLSSGGTQVLGSHGTVYGPGGQGVYDDPKLGPVLYYHYVDTTVGYADADKRLGINTIDFSSGWPVVFQHEMTRARALRVVMFLCTKKKRGRVPEWRSLEASAHILTECAPEDQLDLQIPELRSPTQLCRHYLDSSLPVLFCTTKYCSFSPMQRDLLGLRALVIPRSPSRNRHSTRRCTVRITLACGTTPPGSQVNKNSCPRFLPDVDETGPIPAHGIETSMGFAHVGGTYHKLRKDT